MVACRYLWVGKGTDFLTNLDKFAFLDNHMYMGKEAEIMSGFKSYIEIGKYLLASFVGG